MIRTLVAVLMVGVAGISANGQQIGLNTPETNVTAPPYKEAEIPDKAESLRRIALLESVAQQAEAAHSTGEGLAKIYRQLGDLYQGVAIYPKSEDAMRRAISLLRNGPRDQKAQLADALGRLGVLHVAMAELQEAQKDELEELQIRESAGEPIGIALAQSDLAGLLVKQRHFKKAADLAQKTMDVLANNPQVDPGDRIAVRQTLGSALCGSGDCARGIPMLKDAVEMAKTNYGADSLSAAFAEYLLGYDCWRGGDMVDAAEWMQRGTARMKVTLGWGHPIYVNAMGQYAKFLRQRGQMEAAATAEREVKQANAVVDVRSFVGRP